MKEHMTTSNTPRNGLWLAYQIVAAASTIVVGSALALAVVLLALALCKQIAHTKSHSTTEQSSEPVVTAEELLGVTEFSWRVELNSQPAGARVYQLGPYASPQSLGVTPYSETASCQTAEPSPNDYGWFTIDSVSDGLQVKLQCLIAKDGYESQILTQVLADVVQPATSNDLPAQLSYTAVLKPVSSRFKRIGRAQLVNGRAIGVVPDGLDVTEGVYEIDILGSDKVQ